MKIPVMSHEFPLPGPSPWPEPKGEALPDTFAAAIGAEAARWGKSGWNLPGSSSWTVYHTVYQIEEVQGFIQKKFKGSYQHRFDHCLVGSFILRFGQGNARRHFCLGDSDQSWEASANLPIASKFQDDRASPVFLGGISATKVFQQS